MVFHYLFNILIIVTTVSEGSFRNVNVACKADNILQSSLMDKVDKEEMQVKRHLL